MTNQSRKTTKVVISRKSDRVDIPDNKRENEYLPINLDDERENELFGDDPILQPFGRLSTRFPKA